MSGLELGRRSKGLKRHFALWWCCDACSCHEQTLRYKLGGCRVQEHDHKDSLLLSAGSFALLFCFIFWLLTFVFFLFLFAFILLSLQFSLCHLVLVVSIPLRCLSAAFVSYSSLFYTYFLIYLRVFFLFLFDSCLFFYLVCLSFVPFCPFPLHTFLFFFPFLLLLFHLLKQII